MIKKDIYIIRNDINNKVYIGQAKDSNERFISHCKKSSANGTSIIDKAIQKHGASHFWYEILEPQIENYNERERYWISKYNSITPNGYNIQPGGEEPPVHYGIDHPLSTFSSDKEIEDIKYELKYTRYSMSEIAARHNSTKRTIIRINYGLHYGKEGEKYPLRENPLDSFKLDNNSVKEIIHILKNTYRQYDDIGDQFDISGKTVKEINFGKMWHIDGEDYPIRKYKNSGRALYTKEQISNVHELLSTTDLSYTEISKLLGIERAAIYNINKGLLKRYVIDSYEYPIRKVNHKRKPVSTIPRKGSTSVIDTQMETEALQTVS